MIELRKSQTQIPIDTNVNDRVEEITNTNPIDTNVNDRVEEITNTNSNRHQCK